MCAGEGLGAAGEKAVLCSLVGNTTLRMLWLGLHDQTGAAAKAMADLLHGNTTLRLKPESFGALAESVARASAQIDPQPTALPSTVH